MSRILLTHSPEALDNYYGVRALAGLRKLGDVVLHSGSEPLQGEGLIQAARDCPLVVSYRQSPAPAALFERLPGLVAFLRCAIDIRNVDVAAASRAGVLVTQASAGFVTSVAEMVIGMMIDLSRGITAAASTYHSGSVPKARMGKELRGSTLGVIGYGAIAFVMKDPQFLDANGAIRGGPNMAAIHLSEAMGGDYFLGYIAAVAFATIVAVVAGLTIAGASAISHDLYANIFRHGRATDQEVVKVSRIAAVVIGAIGIGLGIAFKDQNIAYMIVIPFTVSSSVFFPLLFLSMYWPGLTTRGAVAGGYVGLGLGMVLLLLGPTLWKEILGHAEAIFPYKYPALFTIIASSLTMIVISKFDNSERAKREIAEFEDQFVRSQTGLGSEEAAVH